MKIVFREMSLNAEQLQVIVGNAVSSALAAQKEHFEEEVAVIDQRLDNVTITSTEIETYQEI